MGFPIGPGALVVAGTWIEVEMEEDGTSVTCFLPKHSCESLRDKEGYVLFSPDDTTGKLPPSKLGTLG